MQISDILILVANSLVIYSLVPSIRSNQKPHIKTSLYNVLVCSIFVVVFILLNIWVGILMNALIGIMWGVLAYQRFNEKKEDPDRFKEMEDKFDMENTID